MELRRFFIVIVAIFPYSCQLLCCARSVIGPEFALPDGVTIVSDNREFELGFFPVKKSLSKGRYVGIWYAFSPDNVIWVANRDKPINGSSGVFRIHDGNLQVFDNKTGTSHWSTEIETSTSSNLTAKLNDTGNLVLLESGETLWQSFEHPTDTFLPGMKMITGLKLTSWSRIDDPKPGSFTFSLDDKEKEPRYIITKGFDTYWKSGGRFVRSDKIPTLIAHMLSAFVFKLPLRCTKYIRCLEKDLRPDYNEKELRPVYNRTRLVITLNGSFEFLRWDNTRMDWLLIWFEPTDRCSINNACGSFGSCNNLNVLPCKCLPGFKPKDSDHWNSGDFSEGCIPRVIQKCGGMDFLSLTKMNLANSESPYSQSPNETACRKECLENCKCQAYSFKAKSASRDSKDPICTAWLEEYLQDIQEENTGGENLFVRVAFSDLEQSVRNCRPCGTTTIPYPLSTGPGCGDPAYYSFQCDKATGRATFKVLKGEYRVDGIDQDTRKFLIEIPHLEENCNLTDSSGKSLQLDKLLPFKVTNWCYTGFGNFNSHVSNRSKGLVEIEWEPPQEPTCTKDSDCRVWPNSSCKNVKDGETKRCLCSTPFIWDVHFLNCTRRLDDDPPMKNTQLALIIAPTVVSVAVLACVFVAFIIWRRKTSEKQGSRKSDPRSKVLHKLDTQNRIKHLMDSGEFEAEDEEAIDVPFFDFESIVAATNDFSDANKLGEGGYGPVYKGTFPGGQEIAIKRLSSVSGQGLQEFKNEVVLIAKLQHRNLVKLRGYCIQGEEKILLYEYMPNKSLDSLFASQSSNVILDWEKRFNIILGIARGLLYLHQDSRLRIIHRDFKTSNILLDEDLEPKISDFGLARIVGGKQTEANTNRIVGTYGYMSPEYALEGLFSVKSDVFSFGVVLLEIISGRRNTRLVQSEPPLSLLGYAWRLWTENKVLDLIDPALTQSCRQDQFLKCFKISLLCVQEDPGERPTMSTVLTWLDSEMTVVPTPQQPAFVLRRGSTSISSSSSVKPEITVTFEAGR